MKEGDLVFDIEHAEFATVTPARGNVKTWRYVLEINGARGCWKSADEVQRAYFSFEGPVSLGLVTR